jgi:hypothetical protein
MPSEKIFVFVILYCDLVRGGVGAGFKTGVLEDPSIVTKEDCARESD